MPNQIYMLTTSLKLFRSLSRMASFYKLTPLKIGCDVQGVDLRTENRPEVITQIKKDVTEHRILVFKDQGIINGDRHVEISRWFGELESTFYKHPRSPHPDVFRVSNDASEGCTGPYRRHDLVGRSGRFGQVGCNIGSCVVVSADKKNPISCRVAGASNRTTVQPNRDVCSIVGIYTITFIICQLPSRTYTITIICQLPSRTYTITFIIWVGRTGWHIDGSFQSAPFSYSLYHMVSVPKLGATAFAPLTELIEGLSPERRAEWKRLWMMSDRRSGPLHPLIYPHPHTGKKETSTVESWKLDTCMCTQLLVPVTTIQGHSTV
uniref:TauD/TfdA-like domain-containing protein n=1 Tax=Timema monikensis TaxID=170555 RepID=A0A7R9E1E5_9NEOP|nr:unnamed protein product [Timema monikensis]